MEGTGEFCLSRLLICPAVSVIVSLTLPKARFCRWGPCDSKDTSLSYPDLSLWGEGFSFSFMPLLPEAPTFSRAS